MLYFFLAPRGYRKLFVVKRDSNPKTGETLCTYYLRTHPHVIPDEVEFWEADESTGAFAKLDENLEGLIHISEISDKRIEHPREILKVDDIVTLRIIKVDTARRRIGLSMRKVESMKYSEMDWELVLAEIEEHDEEESDPPTEPAAEPAPEATAEAEPPDEDVEAPESEPETKSEKQAAEASTEIEPPAGEVEAPEPEPEAEPEEPAEPSEEAQEEKPDEAPDEEKED